MIFKTIESSIDKSRTSLALFNKDWNIFKTNWQNASGGFKNKFATIFNSNDVNCLKEYNRQIQAGIKPSVAYRTTMMGCTQEAKKNAVAMAKGAMTYEQATSSINGMTLAMKALSIAGNMLVFWGISKAIEMVTGAIDKNINRVKYANEALADSKSKYDETTQSIEDLQKEIDDCIESIKDLQSQVDNGTISVTDEEQLHILKETNEELERQLKVKQELQLIAAEEAVNNADKLLGTYHQSKYMIDDVSDGHQYDLVTPSEELQASIDEYNRLSEAINNLNSKRDEGNISAEKYEEELSKLNKQQLEARKRANEMYTILNDSKTSYDDYIKIGGELSDTNKKNYSVVSDSISVYENFIDAVDTTIKSVEKLNEVQTSMPDKTVISFSDLFNTSSIDDTKQKLLDLATSGELSAETITSTKKYKALLDQLGISADEFVEKIEAFNIENIKDNYTSLTDLLSRVRNGETLSGEEAANLIAKYDKLAGELVTVGDAYSFNESALISLINQYAENGNLAISNQVKQTEETIKEIKNRIKVFGIEMSVLEKLQAAYEKTGSIDKTRKYGALFGVVSTQDVKGALEAYAELQGAESSLQELIESLKFTMLDTAKVGTSALDRITNKYKELTDIIGSNVNLIKSQISLLEAQDKEVGKAYYEELINQSATKLDVLNKQFSELRQQFLNTPKNTEEWLELNAAILETQESIIQTRTEVAEYQKTLDNMKWDRLEKEFDALSDTIESNKDIIESHISLLESQDKEIGKGFYEELINNTEKQIDLLNDRHKTLMEQLSTVEEGSEKWIELNQSIFDCQKSIIDTKKSVAEYQKTLDSIQWERLEEKFESLSDIIESNSSLIESQISLLETQGSTVGRGFYVELITQTEKKIALLTDRYKTLNEQILTVDEGSDKWIELNQSIFEIQKSLIEAKEDIEKFQNSIDELHWNTLNDITDAIKEISDEAGNITDLLNLDDIVDADGNYTQDAITVLAMYGEQLETAQYLINKYSEEMDYLNEEYIKGSITAEEYNEKMKELNELQWDSVDAYNAAKKAIIDLRKNGIEKEIDALEELYDARKKAWEQGKDQYDWEKTVAENETNKNKLKDQIIELQNDNSLAGIKKRKELEDELSKLESDWEDTLYDHVYDERNDQLDKELEDKKKALENTLTDEEQLVADSIDMVNSHASEVLENLNRLSKQYGIQMSESITKPFEDGENALSRYSEQFSNAQSSFTTQLDNTANNIYAVQKSADDTALSILNMFMTTNDTLNNQLNITSDKINQAHTDADNAALGFLTMFQSTNGTLDAQLDTTSSKINQLYLDADNASLHIVNMFNSTNGTLLDQLSLVKGAIESVQSAADKAYQSIANMMAEQAKTDNDNRFPTLKEIVTSDSWLPSVSEINADKGYQEYKNRSKQTGVPYADVSSTNKNEPKQTTTDTKTTTTTTVVKEEKKKTTVSKGGNKVAQVQFGEGYASGTKSATPGYHPTFENGTEIIEKDGVLLVPYDGGEHVFNNEQVQRLWELSKDIKFNMPPNAVKSDYSKLISNINTSARNQSVNVEQKFDALIKVDGDMTPDVLQQIRNDKNIKKDIKNLALEGFVEAYETRGYRIR